MAYVVLARRWRPQTFDDLVGQQHIATTLKNSIKSDRLAHAYLFVGPRGIGKTSTARILAKAMNCEKGPAPEPCNACTSCSEITAGNSIDVIEIDAASNSGVDDVRELRDNVRFAPVRSRLKIYIIDEVHMLSGAAFNALLKTLEEPPAHTKFILATTEVRKLPATIISRCQRFDFRRISEQDILDRLKEICAGEHIEFELEALLTVAKTAEGSLRDAESILDQLISFCESRITYKDVDAVLGLVDWRVFHELCTALRDGNIADELAAVDEIVSAGKDLGQFVRDLTYYFRHMLVCKVTGSDKLISMPADERAKLTALANRFTVSELLSLVEKSATVAAQFRGQFAGRVALEVFLMSATKIGAETSVNAILEKLLTLEERLQSAPPEPTGDVVNEELLEIMPERQHVSVPSAARPPDELWRALLDAIAQESNLVSSFLSQGRPLGVEDNKFVVEFGSDQHFYIENVQKRSARDLIEAKITDIFGQELVFRVRLAETGPPVSSQPYETVGQELAQETVPVASEPIAPPHNAERVDDVPMGKPSTPSAKAVADDEKVKMVLNVFGGAIVRVEKGRTPE